MNLGFAEIATQAGLPIWALALVIIWTLAWKGVAWWQSARKGHIIWFILFFMVHTMGILEILYIFLFSKFNLKTKENKKGKKKKSK